jgi:hypothetical protein
MNTWKVRAALMTRASVIGLVSDSSIKSSDARSTRARLWTYIFKCYEQNKGGTRPGAPKDGTIKVKEDDSANEHIIQ